MNYSVKINKVYPSENKVRAIASVIIDNAFCVHGLKIVDGSKGRFVAMPQTKPNGEYFDIFHPVNNDSRQELWNAVFAAYDEFIENGEAE